MSSLLAHVKVVKGQEEKFEELQKELYNQSHANEDCIIRYEHYRGRDKNSYYTLLVYPTYLDFLLKYFHGPMNIILKTLKIIMKFVI